MRAQVPLHCLMDGRQHDFVFEWDYDHQDDNGGTSRQTASLSFAVGFCS
jgi:hypothetical protein